MRFTIVSLSLLCLAGSASASVAGSAYGDQIGPRETAWVEYLNDDFKPSSPDDYLTAGFRGGVVTKGFGIGADYRILTSRKAGTRSDELAITASYDFASREDTVVSIGAGVFNAGDLGGSKVQNAWHRSNASGNQPEVHLTYEPAHYTSPMAIADVRKQWLINEQGGPELDASASAHRIGGVYEVRALWLYVNHDHDSTFAAWIGPGFIGTFGDDVSSAASVVNDKYTGVTFNAGLRLSAVILGIQASRDAGYVSFGVTF